MHVAHAGYARLRGIEKKAKIADPSSQNLLIDRTEIQRCPSSTHRKDKNNSSRPALRAHVTYGQRFSICSTEEERAGLIQFKTRA